MTDSRPRMQHWHCCGKIGTYASENGPAAYCKRCGTTRPITPKERDRIEARDD